MGIDVKMPDGSIKSFNDIQEAKDFKNALLNDPMTGGALQTAGGDTGLAKDTLEIVNKGLEAKSKMRDLEGLSPRQAVETGLTQLEDQLSKIPSGERGVGARINGLWQVGKGYLGYQPDVKGYQNIREGFSRPLMRYLGEKGAMSEGDVSAAQSLIPAPWSTYEERQNQFGQLRHLIGLPDKKPSQSGKYDIGLPKGNIE